MKKSFTNAALLYGNLCYNDIDSGCFKLLELYAGQGLPKDYIIDKNAEGRCVSEKEGIPSRQFGFSSNAKSINIDRFYCVLCGKQTICNVLYL